MQKINSYLRLGCGEGLFHDSRRDINTLGKLINECVDKINELITEVEVLKAENIKLKKENDN
jgi:hypothetical protein